jgi:hypothetical protein
MPEYVIEGIGIIGALAVLIAYALNSYQKIRSDSIGFYLLNLSGGILLIIYSLYKEAWANTVINVVWVLVAAIAIGRFYKKERQ